MGTFTAEATGDGDGVVLKSAHGYVWCEGGGGGPVRVNGTRVDDWSTFTEEAGSAEAVKPEPGPGPTRPGKRPDYDLAAAPHGAFLGVPGYGSRSCIRATRRRNAPPTARS